MAPQAVRPSQLLWPAATVIIVAAGLLALYVAKHGGDLASLLCAGENRIGRHPYEAIETAGGPNGYDGQFYYAIAQDPWRTHDNELIDNPAARHQRILYPALCWLLSGGNPDALLWVMPCVNLLALGGITALGAWLAAAHGRSPWWGVALPASLNAALPAMHNLTDPIAMLAVAALLAVWLARGPAWLIALTAAAAVFAREQNLAVVGILGLAGLWRGRTPATCGLAVSVLAWVAWVGVLRATYGTWPFLDGAGNFGPPLEGMLFRWEHPGGNDGFSRRLSIFFVAAMVHLTLQLALAGYLTLRRPLGAVTGCMLAGAGLALVAGTSIYGDFWSFTRVFVWLPLGIWLIGLRGPANWPLLALLPAVLWPIAGALRYV
jgi:hypothetical protein